MVETKIAIVSTGVERRHTVFRDGGLVREIVRKPSDYPDLPDALDDMSPVTLPRHLSGWVTRVSSVRFFHVTVSGCPARP